MIVLISKNAVCNLYVHDMPVYLCMCGYEIIKFKKKNKFKIKFV